MAKSGFWLRGAKGKLAGTTLYRSNGETQQREIVTPKNPKTNSQMIQRAIMASVMRAYSHGKAIFDHSFQGVSVGMKSMQAFQKENANILRTLVANEINTPQPSPYHNRSELKARLAAPGVNTGCGWEDMLISKGTYTQSLFTIIPATKTVVNQQTITTPLKVSLPTPEGIETCKQYAERVGLIANDYYTICGFVYDAGQGLNNAPDYINQPVMAIQYPTYFFYIRMKVKSDFVYSESPVSLAKYSDLFDIDSVNNAVGLIVLTDLMNNNISSEFTMRDIMRFKDDVNSAGMWVGIIRSRLDQDLRSTSTLYRSQYYEQVGIIAPYILDIWKPEENKIGGSDLILEGGYNNAAAAVAPAPAAETVTMYIPVTNPDDPTDKTPVVVNRATAYREIIVTQESGGETHTYHPSVLTVTGTDGKCYILRDTNTTARSYHQGIINKNGYMNIGDETEALPKAWFTRAFLETNNVEFSDAPSEEVFYMPINMQEYGLETADGKNLEVCFNDLGVSMSIYVTVGG